MYYWIWFTDPLAEVIKQMEDRNIAFVGPKGSGKSTTLLESHYFALKQGKPAKFMDLVSLVKDDSLYDESGIYFLVDSAQNLRKDKMKSVMAMLQLGKVCLAFSSSTLTSRGISFCNSNIKNLSPISFLPFTNDEVNQKIVKERSINKRQLFLLWLVSVSWVE